MQVLRTAGPNFILSEKGQWQNYKNQSLHDLFFAAGSRNISRKGDVVIRQTTQNSPEEAYTIIGKRTAMGKPTKGYTVADIRNYTGTTIVLRSNKTGIESTMHSKDPAPWSLRYESVKACGEYLPVKQIVRPAIKKQKTIRNTPKRPLTTTHEQVDFSTTMPYKDLADLITSRHMDLNTTLEAIETKMVNRDVQIMGILKALADAPRAPTVPVTVTEEACISFLKKQTSEARDRIISKVFRP